MTTAQTITIPVPLAPIACRHEPAIRDVDPDDPIVVFGGASIRGDDEREIQIAIDRELQIITACAEATHRLVQLIERLARRQQQGADTVRRLRQDLWRVTFGDAARQNADDDVLAILGGGSR